MRTGVALGLVLGFACPALPCSLCANVRQAPTFRLEAAQSSAHLVLLGTLENPQLARGVAGSGTTDFRVIEVLRATRGLPAAYQKRKGDIVVLPSYVPISDPANPPVYVLFCSTTRDGVTPYRPVPLTSAKTADYVKAALSLPDNDARLRLNFYFRHLGHPDAQVSTDAFLELSRATDSEIGELGKILPPEPLRRLIQDPKTPEVQLGLLAFLLGSCGTSQDAAWFKAVLTNPAERFASAYDGVLGGYIQMHPREGWVLAERVLREGKKQLPMRLSAVRTLRFFMAWKPAEARAPVRRCLSAILAQGELTDLAAEDLRRWQMWELTSEVLAQYGRRGLDAPIHRRAILRYALSCPHPAAQAFVANLRRRNAEEVREVEEGLRGFDSRY